MPKLYSAKQVISALRRAGFEIVSQRGSHIKMRGIKAGKIQTVIIPNFKEIPMGTFSSILSQANLTRAEFDSYIK
ncbi:MAG: type II toxin-antitoxin system HicA family toxin [Patescibacteria group bacterium]|nr:type II toxin-antitoxin system HicA family toxin [Patescibacteria group bacterium]MCL5095828.1 type II toxin-antitoxin system HicA family toxin [Patescibacteria group bacterium]